MFLQKDSTVKLFSKNSRHSNSILINRSSILFSTSQLDNYNIYCKCNNEMQLRITRVPVKKRNIAIQLASKQQFSPLMYEEHNSKEKCETYNWNKAKLALLQLLQFHDIKSFTYSQPLDLFHPESLHGPDWLHSQDMFSMQRLVHYLLAIVVVVAVRIVTICGIENTEVHP